MTTVYLGRHLPAMGFQPGPRLGSSRQVDRTVYTYRFEPSSSHLPSTQINKFMPCTQLMFTSNILHVEDNFLLEWKENCKVSVVGLETGFDSDSFESTPVRGLFEFNCKFIMPYI